MTDAWTETAKQLAEHEDLEARAEASGYTDWATATDVIDKAEASRVELKPDHEPEFSTSPRSVADAIDSNFRIPTTREEREAEIVRETGDVLAGAVEAHIMPELRAARLEAQELRDVAFVTAYDGLPDVDDETSQQFVESVARGIAEFGDGYRDQVIAYALLVEQGIDPEIGLTPEEWAEFLSDPEVQQRVVSFEQALNEVPREDALARSAALEVGIRDTTSKLYLAATAAALSDLPGVGFEIPADKMPEAVARAKNALEMHPDLMDAFEVPSIEWLDQQPPEVFAEIIANTISTVFSFQRAQETREIGQGMVDRDAATRVSDGLSGGTFGSGTPKERVPLSPDIVLKDLAEQHASRRRVTSKDVAASLARSTKRSSGIEETVTGLFKKSVAAAEAQAKRLGTGR